MADKKESAVVMLQPNKWFVGAIIICLVIAVYQVWAGEKKESAPAPKASASVTPAPETPTPVPPSGGTGSAPPPAIEKPAPKKLVLYKTVKVEECKWSELVELPDNCFFKIRYAEGEWYQLKFWNGEILPPVREGDPPPYWGEVPHSKFWIKGTRGTVEVLIEK